MYRSAKGWGARFQCDLGLVALFAVGCGGESSANPDAATLAGSDGGAPDSGVAAPDSSDAASNDGDATGPGVTCGTETCNPPGGICCIENISEAGPTYISLGLVCEDTCPPGRMGAFFR